MYPAEVTAHIHTVGGGFMYTNVKQPWFTATALSLGNKNVDRPVSLTAFNSDVGHVNYGSLEV